MMRKKNTQGYILASVVIFFAVVMIVTTSMLFYSTSNTRMSIRDSQYQQLAYIAESGNNAFFIDLEEELSEAIEGVTSKEALFERFEDAFVGEENKRIINTFDPSNPDLTATTVMTIVNITEDRRVYAVKTTATDGRMERTIMDGIELAPVFHGGSVSVDPFIYSSRFEFTGSCIEGAGRTLVTDGITTVNLNGGSALNVSTMYFNSAVAMDGGSTSFGSSVMPGKIHVNGNLSLWNGMRNVYGEVYVRGDLRLKDARMHHDVYVDGNVELGWTPQIHGNIYYTGTLTHPSSYNTALLSKMIKVSEVPSFSVPLQSYALRPEGWYAAQGYNQSITYSGGTLREDVIPKGAKRFVESYRSSHWSSPLEDIVIVSKGDIVIEGGGRTISGFLFAPNGTVTLNIAQFTGIIVSKEGVLWKRGGSTFQAKSLEEIFSVESQYPFILNAGEGPSGGGEGLDMESSLTIRKLNQEQ